VKTKQGHFKPDTFEDRYEEALKDFLKKKAAGKPIERVEHKELSNVVNLMDALRASVKGEKPSDRRKAARSRPRAAKRGGSSTARQKKAG
jgi:non-homologous end joining protein Ku